MAVDDGGNSGDDSGSEGCYEESAASVHMMRMRGYMRKKDPTCIGFLVGERLHVEKKKNKDRITKGAVTNSWGKFGVIKETDIWNKRPEFTAWLAEVRQVNLETLPNWEEKQMFKQFMEDHNTATFPSKKYYDLDAYHRHKMDKALKKGLKNALATERTNFNDEEQRRQELLVERERQKEEKVELLKRSIYAESGMLACKPVTHYMACPTISSPPSLHPSTSALRILVASFVDPPPRATFLRMRTPAAVRARTHRPEAARVWQTMGLLTALIASKPAPR
ncbi:hypothetical protein KSP39_PZI013693 [Platanthera zijinensis]|uniref:Uncharacterized protein n=1 Tax=Platanthera zijinensis TaxID=2320716 RepID=A0AAP0BDX4_9ASPA